MELSTHKHEPKRLDGRISKASVLKMPQDLLDRATQNVLKACQRGKIASKAEAGIILMALGLDTAEPATATDTQLDHRFSLPEFLT